MITGERAEPARKEYMEKLRKDAYIKISETYRAAVSPLLGIGSTPASSTSGPSPSPATSAEKKSDTNSNKP
jgi:hypothetical protein